MTSDSIVDLADFAEEPLTQSLVGLVQLVETWPLEVRCLVTAQCGDLAMFMGSQNTPANIPVIALLTALGEVVRVLTTTNDAANTEGNS